jgi:hypothetical protein
MSTWLSGEPKNDCIDGRFEEDPLCSSSHTPYLIDGSRFNSLIIGSALGVVGGPP